VRSLEEYTPEKLASRLSGAVVLLASAPLAKRLLDAISSSGAFLLCFHVFLR